jgi:ribosome maturation protein Sdo1
MKRKRKELIEIFVKLFQTTRDEGLISNILYEGTVTLIKKEKSRKSTIQQKERKL